jgi:hypothetical protein
MKEGKSYRFPVLSSIELTATSERRDDAFKKAGIA